MSLPPAGFHKVMEGIHKAIELGYSPVKVRADHCFCPSALAWSFLVSSWPPLPYPLHPALPLTTQGRAEL